MLFKPELCHLILLGLKTQTRRLGHAQTDCATYETPLPGTLISISRNGRVHWRVGHTYAVQPGRGQGQVGRIRITAICQERLRDITEADAQAEGCDGIAVGREGEPIYISKRDHFALLWDSIHRHPHAWGDNPLVWVLTFELAAAEGA